MCTRTQGPQRDWDRTVFEHLLQRYGSAVVCRRDRGSGCGDGISPLGGGHHYLPQSCQNLHRTRKWTLGGHNRALCTRTREEGTVTPQETCLWVSRSLWRRHGSVVACCRAGGTDCGSTCMGPFEGGHRYLHYLHHSLAPGKQQGGNTAPPINRKFLESI